jgi:hypothetical protein
MAIIPPFVIIITEAVPKLIDCALARTVLDQPLAVSQAFSLAKLRFLKVAVPKLQFWNRLHIV